MAAIKEAPQSYNGIVRMLDRCSAEHDGCKCGQREECVHHFDSLADIIPNIRGYKGKCYRYSLRFLKDAINDL